MEANQEREPGNRIHSDSFGKVLVSVYRNVSQKDGVYYRIKFHRKETDGEKSWLAMSYFPEDMQNLSRAATACGIWLLDNTDYVPSAALTVVTKFGRSDSAGEDLPVNEFQVGNVLASVWENTSRTGKVYYKISLRRGEFVNSEESRFWNNVRPEDLSHVAQAASNCRMWFNDRNKAKGNKEKKQPAKRKLQRAAK